MYYIFLAFLFLLYTLCFYGVDILPGDKSFQYISMALYLIMSIWYLIRNRKNSLFCPEIIMLLLGFIITFYDVLVLNNLDSVSSLFRQIPEKMIRKSTCLSLIGFDAFIFGEEMARRSYLKNGSRIQFLNAYTACAFALPMHFLTFLMVILIFLSGRYVVFMKYNTSGSSEGLNMMTIMISVFIMVSTVLEFQRICKLVSRPKNFVSFLKEVNKVYVLTVVVWSLFLIMTGNRGDMMLIILPPLILYFFFVKQISNKTVLAGSLIGLFVMVYIGITRDGITNFNEGAAELGMFALFRDYGAAFVNQQGLIQYTDTHGIYGLSYGLGTLVSSVPFLGGLLLGDTSTGSIGNTNKLTTDQWQLADNLDSGLGTNLLGDLYYAGGIPFVIIYMLVLGWFLSYAYERMYRGKWLNAFSVFTYCWLFSDSLYILRASYYSLFRPIGFSLFIYFFLYVISKNSSEQHRFTRYRG